MPCRLSAAAVPIWTELCDDLRVFESLVFTCSPAYLSPITCLVACLSDVLGHPQVLANMPFQACRLFCGASLCACLFV